MLMFFYTHSIYTDGYLIEAIQVALLEGTATVRQVAIEPPASETQKSSQFKYSLHNSSTAIPEETQWLFAIAELNPVFIVIEIKLFSHRKVACIIFV